MALGWPNAALDEAGSGLLGLGGQGQAWLRPKDQKDARASIAAGVDEHPRYVQLAVHTPWSDAGGENCDRVSSIPDRPGPMTVRPR